MSSSNELEDSNDSKSAFIDKLIGEMKSEFNKKNKLNRKIEDEEDDLLPPKLKCETNDTHNESDENKTCKQEVPSRKSSDSSNSSVTKVHVKQNSSKSVKNSVKGKETVVKEETLDVETVESETKPRIVLTFRTEKSKSTVTSSYSDKDNSVDEVLSPGRRSLRIKTNSMEEKEKNMETAHTGLKRSARRRSKDCTESILQSAIARKEKSYNETTRPQRLTRKLKPTAKILANLEMCQKSAIKNDKQKQNNKTMQCGDRQRFSYDKLEKGSEQAIIESDLDYSKHEEQHHRKRRNKESSLKSPVKKLRNSKTEDRDSDSISSSQSSQEVENAKSPEEKNQKVDRSRRKSSSDTDSIKPHRRSQRKSGRLSNSDENPDPEPLSGTTADEENNIPSHPESSIVIVKDQVIKQCLCQTTSQVYVKTYNCNDVFCTALDSINDKIVGCNNTVSDEVQLLRPSTRIPFAVLCDIHKERLFRHNCCPTCGLFCTQGRFVLCPANHQYHRDCQLEIGENAFCPHCGLTSPIFDTEIVMKCLKTPVFLLNQKAQYPSAKMTFHSNPVDENRSSPPLIPSEDLQFLKNLDNFQTDETFDLNTLYEALKENDCEKVALILNNTNFDLNEPAFENQDGITLLHFASQSGLLVIAHLLIIAGAEVDVLDREQNTPLMLAIQSFSNSVVKYLIKCGASIDLKGTDGMSALHIAAKCGNLEACELLLSSSTNRDIFVNCIDDGGWTPLVWACEHGHEDVTRYLIQSGADPSLRDVEQNVALHWAAFSGSSQITELLLNSGCEVNAINAHGDSPLHVAARQDKYNCVLMLLARGANVHLKNKSFEYPLDLCASNSGDCYSAILLNVQLQNITENSSLRKKIILSNDISRGKENNPIQCINTVDDEPKPTDFVYVIKNCITSNINIDNKITTLQSCKCEDRCATSDCLCSNNSLKCWYTDEEKLSLDFNYTDPPMLFECNPMCSCNAITCKNRVVQHGLMQRFQLFKTAKKGWGIKTLRLIPKGSYVCEYIGEIISDLEADQREDDSYLFDLDNRDEETYCIDARRYGNLSRFINHSCDPNLLPVRLFVDHQDLRFPRIAFFANRDIQADEELGFDYGDKFWIIKYKSFTCTCGYELCRYSETTIKTTLKNYQRRLEEQESIQEVN